MSEPSSDGSRVSKKPVDIGCHFQIFDYWTSIYNRLFCRGKRTHCERRGGSSYIIANRIPFWNGAVVPRTKPHYISVKKQ